MSIYVNSANSINISAPNFRSQNGNSVSVPNNTLERVPQNDTINIPQKKKTKNTIIGLGLAILTATGAIFALKQGKKIYIEKAQKTFQEVFMRENISKEETIEMLKRYKEIYKIKDKDERIKSVFEEAKKNFGFEKSNIKLKIEKLKDKENGSWKFSQGTVRINKDIKDYNIFNTVHHELRHAKQSYWMANYSPEKYCRAFCERENGRVLKEAFNNKTYEEILKDKKLKAVLDTIIPDYYKKCFNGELSKNNVPEKLYEYIEKCIKAEKNYVLWDKNYKEYHANFLEEDARKAGASLDKLLNFIWLIK